MPHVQEPSADSVGAGAPDNEIEITSAMIEAGIEALKREPGVDCSYSEAWNLAEDVIRRALQASVRRTD